MSKQTTSFAEPMDDKASVRELIESLRKNGADFAFIPVDGDKIETMGVFVYAQGFENIAELLTLVQLGGLIDVNEALTKFLKDHQAAQA